MKFTAKDNWHYCKKTNLRFYLIIKKPNNEKFSYKWKLLSCILPM